MYDSNSNSKCNEQNQRNNNRRTVIFLDGGVAVVVPFVDTINTVTKRGTKKEK